MNHTRSILVASLVLAVALAAAAEDAALPAPGSAALVEDAADWEGHTVRFVGEAIGEAMRRGDHAWIHLNDDAYGLAGPGDEVTRAGANSGIGVWVTAEQAGAIARFGDYRRHGDLVEVTGVFHAACPQHGGDLDIHAASLRIVRPGYPTTHPLQARRMIAAGILAVMTLGLLLASLLVDRQLPGRPSSRRRSAGHVAPPG
jgi:hypothetical protein